MRDFSIKKLYYSISEVSKITEVEQYVLRYWETEFEQLQPQKNRAGNRAYTNQDIQLVLLIKHLLRTKKYTIEGAKLLIDEQSVPELIKQLRDETEEKSRKKTSEEKQIDPPSNSKVIESVKEKRVLQIPLDDVAALKKILERLLKFL